MHSSTIRNTQFFYNGDYSGDVKIIRNNIETTIPFEDIRDFVAEYVRNERIAKLESMSTTDLLNLGGI